jgi:hypothetical protein
LPAEPGPGGHSTDRELLVDNVVTSWVSLTGELQYDWAHTETVADVVVLTARLLSSA